jgi:hypothetical protein
MNFHKENKMIWEIVKSNSWFCVCRITDGEIEDGFTNEEDAERFKAHLEAEDGKDVANG